MSDNLETQSKSLALLNFDNKINEFKEFLSITRNFSRTCIDKNGSSISNLAKIIVDLLQILKEETKECRELTRAHNKLVECFLDIVREAKHHSKITIPYLESAKQHLNVIHDVMKTNPYGKINEVDKKDLKIALKRISNGANDLISNSKYAVSELKKSTNAIRELKTTVQLKQEVVLKNSEKFMMLNRTGEFGAKVFSSLGYAGAFILAGTALTPAAVVLAVGSIGLSISSHFFTLMKGFYDKKQNKALEYLNIVFESLVMLDNANESFISTMKAVEEKASTFNLKLESIQDGLESESGRYARSEASSNAVNAMTTLIESLKQIECFDISEKRIRAITIQ